MCPPLRNIFASRLNVELSRLEAQSAGLVPGLSVTFNPALLDAVEEDAISRCIQCYGGNRCASRRTTATAAEHSPTNSSTVADAAPIDNSSRYSSVLWALLFGGEGRVGSPWFVYTDLGSWVLRMLSLYPTPPNAVSAVQHLGSAQATYSTGAAQECGNIELQRRADDLVKPTAAHASINNNARACAPQTAHNSAATNGTAEGPVVAPLGSHCNAPNTSGTVEQCSDNTAASRNRPVPISGASPRPNTAGNSSGHPLAAAQGCRLLVLFSRDYQTYWKVNDPTEPRVGHQQQRCTCGGHNAALGSSSLDILLSSNSALLQDENGGDSQQLLRAAVETFQYRTTSTNMHKRSYRQIQEDMGQSASNDNVVALFLIEVYEDYPFFSPLVSCLYISVPAVYRHVRTLEADFFTRNVILCESWSPKITLESMLERIGSFVRQSLQQDSLKSKSFNGLGHGVVADCQLCAHKKVAVQRPAVHRTSAVQLGAMAACGVVFFLQHLLRIQMSATTGSSGAGGARYTPAASPLTYAFEILYKWFSGDITSKAVEGVCTVPLEMCLLLVEVVLCLTPTVLLLVLRSRSNRRHKVQLRSSLVILLSAMLLMSSSSRHCDVAQRLPSAVTLGLTVATVALYSSGHMVLAIGGGAFAAAVAPTPKVVVPLLLPLLVGALSLGCCERSKRGLLRVRSRAPTIYVLAHRVMYIVATMTAALALAMIPRLIVRYAAAPNTSALPVVDSTSRSMLAEWSGLIKSCLALAVTVFAQVPSLVACWRKPSALRLTCSILCGTLPWYLFGSKLIQSTSTRSGYSGSTLQILSLFNSSGAVYSPPLDAADGSWAVAPPLACTIILLSLVLLPDIGYLSVFSVGLAVYHFWTRSSVSPLLQRTSPIFTTVAVVCVAVWLGALFTLVPHICLQPLQCQRISLRRKEKSQALHNRIWSISLDLVVLPSVRLVITGSQIFLSDAEFIRLASCADRAAQFIAKCRGGGGDAECDEGVLFDKKDCAGHGGFMQGRVKNTRAWFDTYTRDVCTAIGVMTIACVVGMRFATAVLPASPNAIPMVIVSSLDKLFFWLLGIVLLASTSYAALSILTNDDVLTLYRKHNPLRAKL